MLKDKSPQTSNILSVIFNKDYTSSKGSDYHQQRYSDIMNSPKEKIIRLGTQNFEVFKDAKNVVGKGGKIVIHNHCSSKFLHFEGKFLRVYKSYTN